MISLLVSMFLSSLSAQAQSARDEIVTFTISMHQQSCRRSNDVEPFVCSSTAPTVQRLAVTLYPIAPQALEEQAFEGNTHDFGMMLPGAGEYMPWIQVRKSVALNGSSVIYVLRFRTQTVTAQIEQPAVYETVYMSEETLRMNEPLLLMADRSTPNERLTKQTFFSLMPSVQFANLVRDPED
ncbi:MAG: hypothetical protein KF799_14540 [Bdellovibrionales bacterium]|nr:hypothetical protein [Bdellovibrionales bacterium]